MVEKNEKLEHDKNKETQENTPDVSDDGKKKEHDKDNATEKTEIKLADLEEEIDKMMVASDSKSDKKKLEKIKEEIQEKANDQQFLSKKAKEVQEMKKETTDAEYNPSLLKRLWYGTLLGGIGSSFGGNVGKQIKEWSEKKLKEKPKHAEKKSFM